MKKIICALSAMAISAAVLTACGNEEYLLMENNENAYRVIETEPASTKPKVKEIREETTAVDEKSEVDSETTAKSTDNDDKKEESATTAAENPDAPVTDENTENTDNAENTKPVQDNSDEQTVETSAEEQEEYFLEGVVYRKSPQSILINEKDLSLLSISFKDNSVIDSLGIGDEVSVSYDGYILSSYPGMVNDANGAEVVKKAAYEGKINNFVCDNPAVSEGFTVLLPKDWTVKQIEYPTEGDFTDWGFRFIPKGEETGIDVTWHSSFSVRESYDIFPVTVNGYKAEKYSIEGKWQFYGYENGYVISNNFFGTDKYDEYADEFEFILNTLVFGQTEFIGE